MTAAALSAGLVAALLAGTGPAAEPETAEAYSFGSTPWSDAGAAAAAATRPGGCSVSNTGLRALMLAPVWGETGAGTGTPSPMTLSRYDNQAALYSFGNTTTYRAAFWHPGVGMWQFDSAGGGSSWGLATAAEHISTASASGSGFTANEMLGRYCAAKAGGASDENARKAAWAPWHACSGTQGLGTCQKIFAEIVANGVTGDGSVGRYGGMVARTCSRGAGPTFTCFYVNPAAAQGANGWVNPGWGQSPVTAPFYVYRDGSTEVRAWLREETGYGIDIVATRPLGQNARSSLSWYSSTNLCVRASSAPQTFCDVSPTHPFFAEIEWAAGEDIAQGYADGEFRPANPVSRQAMAAFMYRLAGGGGVSGPAHFSDVTPSHGFYTEIEWLFDQGVVTGYPDGTFRPLQGVSRQAMAAFMYRLAGEDPPIQAHPVPSFNDVLVGRPFYDEIHWLADNSISQGYDDGTFRPDATVTRMAMAAFLQNLDPLV